MPSGRRTISAATTSPRTSNPTIRAGGSIPCGLLDDNPRREDLSTMRRVNIQAAFLGEGGDSDDGDDEGLALSVRGGEVVLVVPAGTSEQRSVEAASMVRGSLRLETGRVLTFEIHDGAVGAFFEDEPGELFDRREQTPADGLSSVSSRPAHRASFGGAEALHGARGYRAGRDGHVGGQRDPGDQRRRSGQAAHVPRYQRPPRVRCGARVWRRQRGRPDRQELAKRYVPS